MQFIFVNGRYIENDEITSSIEKAYNNLIPSGRFPVFELNIFVNPNLIDVNIHPNKQKVKFSFSEELYNLITNTTIDFLYDTQTEKKVESKNRIDTKISFHKLNEGEGYKRILDAYKEPLIVNDENIIEYSLKKEDKNEGIQLNHLYNQEDEYKKIYHDIIDDSSVYEGKNQYNLETLSQQISFDMDRYIFKTVLFNKFILFEDTKDSSIQVIDIDRANTRIIFKNLEKKYLYLVRIY